MGSSDHNDLAVFYLTSIGHEHCTADGDNLFIGGDNGRDTTVKSILFQYTVHIRTDKVRIGRGVDTCIGSIRFGSSIFFVNNDKAAILRIG